MKKHGYSQTSEVKPYGDEELEKIVGKAMVRLKIGCLPFFTAVMTPLHLNAGSGHRIWLSRQEHSIPEVWLEAKVWD